MFNKKMAGAALWIGISLGVMAQQEPGTAETPEATVATAEAVSEEKDVQTMIDEYLASKGWHEGENTKKNGETFFISVGTGVVQAPRSQRNFAASRVAAFNMAMLAAKQQMVEYLGNSIKSETTRIYSEQQTDSTNPDHSMLEEKTQTLLQAKLDEDLKKEGVDPKTAEKEVRAEAAKKLLNSESYLKFISSAAQSNTCGVQVCASFEYTPANGKGKIGVIAIQSSKLRKMAEVMLGGGTIPSGIPKKPIIEQIPTDPAVLLTTFGVQQKLDEKGNLVLVAFGQEGAVSSSSTSANAAYRKAQLNAYAAIREFAGEAVAVGSDRLNAENAAEYENAAEEYSDSRAFQDKITATAAALNISGIATLKRWKVKHPISGSYVYGVICTWSPSSAANARKIKAEMNGNTNAAPNSSGASAPSAPAPKANESELQQNSFEGTGASADEDAF